MDRMTDEEIGDIEKAIWGTEGVVVKHCQKLLQALKAERKLTRELEMGHCNLMQSDYDQRQRISELEQSAAKKDNAIISHQKRISELEAKLDRVRELPDQWIDKSFDPLFDVEDCADELDQVLADD